MAHQLIGREYFSLPPSLLSAPAGLIGIYIYIYMYKRLHVGCQLLVIHMKLDLQCRVCFLVASHASQYMMMMCHRTMSSSSEQAARGVFLSKMQFFSTLPITEITRCTSRKLELCIKGFIQSFLMGLILKTKTKLGITTL